MGLRLAKPLPKRSLDVSMCCPYPRPGQDGVCAALFATGCTAAALQAVGLAIHLDRFSVSAPTLDNIYIPLYTTRCIWVNVYVVEQCVIVQPPTCRGKRDACAPRDLGLPEHNAYHNVRQLMISDGDDTISCERLCQWHERGFACVRLQ